jgi:SnoaL-like domain
MDAEALLRGCYAAFNARDLECALAALHPDVSWPNGWEGGWIQGRDGVREYWRRQWAAIDPQVDPVAFTRDADGRIIVSVHQVVSLSSTLPSGEYLIGPPRERWDLVLLVRHRSAASLHAFAANQGLPRGAGTPTGRVGGLPPAAHC